MGKDKGKVRARSSKKDGSMRSRDLEEITTRYRMRVMVLHNLARIFQISHSH